MAPRRASTRVLHTSDHMTRALVAQQTQEIQHTHGIFFFPSEGKRGGDPATKQMAAATAAAAER